MRRIRSLATIAAFAAALAAPSARAQSPIPITLVGGLNLASTTATGASQATGVLFGVGTEFSLGPLVKLQPELLFQMQGATSPGGSINANYLNVPVFVRYDIDLGPATPVKPVLLAGPNLMLRVSCSITVNSGTAPTCAQASPNGKDPATLDFGLTFGGGLEFKAGGKTLGVGLRYMFGLTDVFTGGDNKNRALQFVGTIRL